MKESAQLYKSSDRFESRDDAFKRFSVFNFEEHQDDMHRPFGSLIAFNDETLGAKQKVFRHVERNVEIVIIPLAGALLYTDSLGNEDIIETQHIRIFSANEGMTYTLENPYPEDLVNYLQIWIVPSEGQPGSSQMKFDYRGKNNLFPIFSAGKNGAALQIRQNSNGFLGIFDDREVGSHTLENNQNGLFAYVLNGTFQIENNLIEKNDAIALGGVDAINFKAFSADSLLMLIEIPV